MDPESLLDKLGFHFSRKKNGGGEVETCQMMEDTWTAVITFTEDDSETALSQCCSGALLLTFVRLPHSCRRFGAQTVPRRSGAEVNPQSQGDALHRRTHEQSGGDPLFPGRPPGLEECGRGFMRGVLPSRCRRRFVPGRLC